MLLYVGKGRKRGQPYEVGRNGAGSESRGLGMREEQASTLLMGRLRSVTGEELWMENMETIQNSNEKKKNPTKNTKNTKSILSSVSVLSSSSCDSFTPTQAIWWTTFTGVTKWHLPSMVQSSVVNLLDEWWKWLRYGTRRVPRNIKSRNPLLPTCLSPSLSVFVHFKQQWTGLVTTKSQHTHCMFHSKMVVISGETWKGDWKWVEGTQQSVVRSM